MRYLILCLLAAALLLATGCNDKDDPIVVPPAPEYVLPFPDTPDQLMANFETAYGDLDLEVYRDEVLANAYDFILQNETVEEFALPDGVFDREEELAIAEAMFSGQPNSEGKVLVSIEIQELEPEGTWNAVPESDPQFGAVPGALFRNYSLLFYFNVQGDFRYEIRGNQLFYVVPDTVMYEGEQAARYRLRGQLDQTSILPKQATESSSWSGVKALWR